MPGIDIVGPAEAETIQLWKGALTLEHCDVLGSIACNGVGAACTLRDALVHDRCGVTLSQRACRILRCAFSHYWLKWITV